MSTTDIWNAFSKELLIFIKSRISDADLAEDILQEIFVKIHTKSHTIQESDKLASWVYQITRNTIIDYYRKKKIITYEEELKVKLPEEESNSDLGCIHCLKPFIEQLPEKDKHVIEKTALDQMSQKEYAETYGLSYTATKSRVQRARRKLKELFVSCCSVKADKYGNIVSANHKHCDC
jgi:RNA polymerase sigma-70 factor (ECF subfamily)